MTASLRSHIHPGQWTTHSEEETFELGRTLGSHLSGGELLLLKGPLGAGKTHFAKGIAAGLDIDPVEVTSPSFTLVNQYEGRLRLYHIDLYRLPQGASAAHAVDIEEILADSQAVTVIEWAERAGNYHFSAETWNVLIEGDGDDPRTITVERVD